jgi:hypothetical protein
VDLLKIDLKLALNEPSLAATITDRVSIFRPTLLFVARHFTPIVAAASFVATLLSLMAKAGNPQLNFGASS